MTPQETNVQVLVHTYHTGGDYEALSARIGGALSGALKHFSARITRVEVHVGDENGSRRGPRDKRCMMEARLEGHQPVAFTHHAETIASAVHGAAHGLARAISGVLGRSK
jgi:hypothetical protein